MENREYFRYRHPTEILDEQAVRPCTDCRYREGCDQPCRRYLSWYDYRLKIAAILAGRKKERIDGK